MRQPEDRTALWNEMLRLGVRKAVVSFSGGNDEGGTDSVELELGDGNKVDAAGLKGGEGLYGILEELPYEKYGSFAGEFQVYGKIIVDLEERTVKISGEESTYQPFDDDL